MKLLRPKAISRQPVTVIHRVVDTEARTVSYFREEAGKVRPLTFDEFCELTEQDIIRAATAA